METITIGADHGGFRLKKTIMRDLAQRGYRVQDLGNTVHDPKDDYPIYAERVAREVATRGGRGILICRNGVGMCIVANKLPRVRAVLAPSPAIAKSSRTHDDSNVLCLGSDYLTQAQAKRIVTVWLQTPFDTAMRRKRRIDQIARIERKKMR